MKPMDYHSLRAFADSWVLLAMMVFFCVAILWVMRPGSRQHYDDAASIPFKDESQ
jgi:cytochrome c oxidase cbb3-type subunit IV